MAVTGRYTAVTERLLVVTEPLPILRAVTELDGSKEPVPYNGIHSGPNLPRTVLPLGLFPQRSCHRGDSLWLAPSAHVCGRLLGREAGRWPTSWGYYSTPVRILQWGVAGAPDSGVRPPMGTDGFVLACALHQQRVWLGVRRYPARTTLQRFWKQGDSPCTPGGGCAPCPLRGDGGGTGTLPNLPPGTRPLHNLFLVRHNQHGEPTPRRGSHAPDDTWTVVH